MSENVYTGEVDITIGGQKCVMVFDWRALAKIHAECGPMALRSILNQSPEVIAKILLAGLAKHHPAITLDNVLDGAPPLITALALIDKAVSFAYFGADGAPDDTSATEDSKKN